jgi:heme oxygenase
LAYESFAELGFAMLCEKSPSVRFSLREAIQPDHEAAERLVEKLNVFQNAQSYSSWLLAMRDVHRHFSRCSEAASLKLGLPLVHDQVMEALENDILKTSGNCAASAMGTKPVTDVSAQLGVAYVLEGSGLGARVLVRRATAVGQVSTHYISTLGDLSQSRWPQFVRALDAHELDIETSIDAARSVFDVLQIRLNEHFA